MNRCPRCQRTYPDSEKFCDADGTALVPAAAPAFVEAAESASGEGQIECPVCGGKAQPGELICNFCGARLGVESAAETYTPAPTALADLAQADDSAAKFVGLVAYHGQNAERRRRK